MIPPHSPAEGDINQVIASAVQARVEAAVAASLADSDLMSQYVASALSQEVTVRDPNTYRNRRTTFLRDAITGAIREAAKAAVAKKLQELAPELEAEVAKIIERDREKMATVMVGRLAECAGSGYAIKVELAVPER